MAFELILIRHGQAEDWNDGGDSQRRLTPFGEESARIVGEALSRMGLGWETCVASPFIRAQQTAELVGANIDHSDAMLTPSSPPDETIATLFAHAQTLSRDGRLLAVGHNPNITSVLGSMVCDTYRTCFSVAPADVAHLWVDGTPDAPRAALLGFFPSKRLRSLR